MSVGPCHVRSRQGSGRRPAPASVHMHGHRNRASARIVTPIEVDGSASISEAHLEAAGVGNAGRPMRDDADRVVLHGCYASREGEEGGHRADHAWAPGCRQRGGTEQEHIPRIFPVSVCRVPFLFVGLRCRPVLRTGRKPLNRIAFRGIPIHEKGAARPWGRPGRARTGLGRGGVGM